MSNTSKKVRGMVTVAATLAGLLSGCNSHKQTASVKTIDELAGGAAAGSSCSGTYQNDAMADYMLDSKVDDATRAQIRRSLSVIPTPMLEEIAAVGARIKISAGDPAACGQGSACYVVKDGASFQLKNDTTVIANALSKQFLEFYFEVVLNTKQDGNKYTFAAQDGKSNLETKRLLALALATDLTADAKVSDELLKALFGGELGGRTQTPAQRQTAWTKLPATKRSSIGRAALVEAADQYFCSTTSRAGFEKYPTTAQVFNEEVLSPLAQAWKIDLPLVKVTGKPAVANGLRLWYPGMYLLNAARRVVTFPFRAAAAISQSVQQNRPLMDVVRERQGMIEASRQPDGSLPAGALFPYAYQNAQSNSMVGGSSCPRMSGLRLEGDGGDASGSEYCAICGDTPEASDQAIAAESGTEGGETASEAGTESPEVASAEGGETGETAAQEQAAAEEPASGEQEAAVSQEQSPEPAQESSPEPTESSQSTEPQSQSATE